MTIPLAGVPLVTLNLVFPLIKSVPLYNFYKHLLIMHSSEDAREMIR